MEHRRFFCVLIIAFLSNISSVVCYDREYITKRTDGSPFWAELHITSATSQTIASNGPLELTSTGNCQLKLQGVTVGVNCIDLALSVLYNIKNASAFSRACAAFVKKYSEWKKEDFRQDAMQPYKKPEVVWPPYSYQNTHTFDGYIPENVQNDILSAYDLYQFSEFQAYIKTLSQYESHIAQLYERISVEQENAPYWITKTLGLREAPSWEFYPGYENQSFPEIVTELYTNIQNEKKAQEKAAHEKQLLEQKRVIVQQRIRNDFTFIHDSIYGNKHDLAVGTIGEQVAARWQARECALEQSEKDNFDFKIKEYRFSQQAADLLRGSCIGSTMFDSCNNAALQESITRRSIVLDGSAIQHCLQQEVMSILEQAAKDHYAHVQSQAIKLFADMIGGMTYIAAEYNQKGDVKKTMLLADFCWAVLDVGMGVGEGIIDGVSNVTHMIAHPLDTAINTAHGVSTAAYYTGRVLYEICGITKDCLINFDVGIDRINRAHTNIKIITDELETKITNMTPRQIARAVTGVCVEVVLTKKCMSTMHRFYQNAQAQMAIVAQKIEQGMCPQVAFAGGGHEVAVAAGAADSLFLMQEANKIKPVASVIPAGSKSAKTISANVPARGRVDSKINERTFQISSIAEKTNKEVAKIATDLGFKKTNYYSRGKAVFKKGNKYITFDRDCHNGGFWKMAESVKELSKRATRLGTYDMYLNRIGG